jgi:acyl-CoA synthetase (AMP-forming)/AMP-acid ligase II
VTTLAKILLDHVERHPEQTAIFLQTAGNDDLPISYKKLIEQAGAYADLYASRGNQPGEVIILILEHGESLIYSFYGAILHGAIPSIMPFLTEKLSPERYRADLASLISVTKPAAVLTYPEFEAEICAAIGNESPVREILLTSEVCEPGGDLNKLTGLTSSPDSITLLQHSSGTTGLQKGVALSHTAIFNQLAAYRGAIQLTAEDVIVSWLPLYHDMGLIAGFIMPILEGVPLVLMSTFDWVRAPQRLLQAVSKYRGTLSWLPNFAYNFCAQKIRDRHLEGVDLSSWRAIINCSEPVKYDSHLLFFEKFKAYGLKFETLQSSYAMAENVFGVTQSDMQRGPAVDEIDRERFLHEHVAQPALDGKPVMKMMSSGKPISNTKIRILDEHGSDVPERKTGEIALLSNSMLTEYYHRPDATSKAFRDGWYLTGDYGYIADGELYVTGRKKDMIIVGGKNVYPQDVESLVGQVAGIHAGRVVAFGSYDEAQGTEEVVVIAETEAQDPDELKAISDAVRVHVTRNSAIALRWVYLVGPKWLLKTSSGKIARSANKEKYLKETGKDQ